MKTITCLTLSICLTPLLFPGNGRAIGPAASPATQLLDSAAKSAAAPKPSAPEATPGEGNTFKEITARCAPPAAGEEVIYQPDFHWNYSLPEMLARFDEMYASPKRLDKRAYWDKAAGSLVLPPTFNGPPVKIGLPLIQALSRHIERALELGYADAVFFPDMGHSHFLIPQALWDSKYSDYPTGETSRMYEDMLSDPAIRLFYHTAEQLKYLENSQPIQDEKLLFRMSNRNIAGPITPDTELSVYQNPESAANTVHDVPDFRWWGAGFNFSAQKDGCFSYRHGGKTYYFDISLEDLPMKPGSDTGEW